MARIQITDSYYIDSDELNWTLKKIANVEEYTDKNGKVIPAHDYEKVLGYYGTFKDAVEGALKHNVGDLTKDMVISIAEYVEHVKKANETFLDKVTTYAKEIK